jgi:hypothetical protein
MDLTFGWACRVFLIKCVTEVRSPILPFGLRPHNGSAAMSAEALGATRFAFRDFARAAVEFQLSQIVQATMGVLRRSV